MSRDVISAVDCAPINPLQSLTSQLSSIGSQLQDIPSFQQKGGASLPSPSQALLPAFARPQSLPLTHPQQQRVDGAHAAFLSKFHEGPPLLHHPQPPPSLFRPIQPSPHAVQQQPQPHPDALVEHFQRLELSQQQQQRHPQPHSLPHSQADEFERIYRQGAQSHPPAAQWLSEFGAQQRMAAVQQQQLQAAHQQIIAGPPQWAAEFDAAMASPQMQHMRPQLPGHAFHSSLPYQPMRPSFFPSHSLTSFPPHTSYQPPPPSQTVQADPKIVEVKDDTVASPSLNVHPVDEASMVNSFSSPQTEEAGGFGGGLNQEMIDRLMNSDDPKWRNSRFLQFISKIKSGAIEFRDNQAIERPAGEAEAAREGAKWADEFEERQASAFPSGWAEDFEQREGLRPLSTADDYNKVAAGWSAVDGKAEDEAVWEEEYRRVVHGEVGDEVGQGVEVDEEKEWQRHFQGHDEFDSFSDINWREALEKAKERPVGEAADADPEYRFTGDAAPQFGDANAAFQEGVRLLERGELKAAIAAFEGAVRLDPEHSEAWCYLGSAQAENEEEGNAIAALLKAVAIDPYNLKALMMLGVSYTNDLEERRALTYLKTWLENNADYQHSTLASSAASLREYQQFYGDAASLHDQVTAMFLSAVSLHPSDPDLHTVMGVLYHLSSDFDKSIDSFKAAIKHRPNDPQLWNKLGATLANSSKSSDAVHAYKRALALRPRYVRALANLAISYANQGLHEEAVAVYLRTLQCNADAAHVWSYLRISLSHLGKEKLVELTTSKNVELFRPYYDF